MKGMSVCLRVRETERERERREGGRERETSWITQIVKVGSAYEQKKKIKF
jgi:hypothetical protein